MIYLVSGTHHPRLAESLKQNMLRLFSSDVSLVVVETGSAVGTWTDGGTVLREDEPGVVPFLRRALGHVREVAKPGDWIVRVDADDYYGINYLSQIRYLKNKGVAATGVPSVYVRTEEGKLYYCESKRSGRSAVGGTLAGRASTFLDFESTGSPWGEDTVWCQEMYLAGNAITPRTSSGYTMCRLKDHSHTYPVSGEQLPHFWNCDAYYLGNWSEEIVSEAPPLGGTKIAPDLRKALEGSNRLRQVLADIALTSQNR